MELVKLGRRVVYVWVLAICLALLISGCKGRANTSESVKSEKKVTAESQTDSELDADSDTDASEGEDSLLEEAINVPKNKAHAVAGEMDKRRASTENQAKLAGEEEDDDREDED